jgi:hypothetical protein
MDSFEELLEDLNGKVTILSNVPVFHGPYSRIYRGQIRGTRELVCLFEAFLAVHRMNFILGRGQGSQPDRRRRSLYHAKSKSSAHFKHITLLNLIHRK